MFLNWIKVSVVASVCCLPLQSEAVTMRFGENIAGVCEITAASTALKKGILFKGDSYDTSNTHHLTLKTNNISGTVNITFDVEETIPFIPIHSLSTSFDSKKMNLVIAEDTSGKNKITVVDTTVSLLKTKQSGTAASYSIKDDIYVWLSAPEINKIDLSEGSYEYLVTVNLDCT